MTMREKVQVDPSERHDIVYYTVNLVRVMVVADIE